MSCRNRIRFLCQQTGHSACIAIICICYLDIYIHNVKPGYTFKTNPELICFCKLQISSGFVLQYVKIVMYCQILNHAIRINVI